MEGRKHAAMGRGLDLFRTGGNTLINPASGVLGLQKERLCSEHDTLSPNWKNGETWKYETSSLSASVASDTTAKEPRLIKERHPLRELPAAPRNSQTFLFTRLNLLISWNKTWASDSGVGAGGKGRVAICRYWAAITLAGHPPPERYSGGLTFQFLEQSWVQRGFTARWWLSQMMEHRAGAEVNRSSVSGQWKQCSISDPPSPQAWCHLVECVIRNMTFGLFYAVCFL